MNTLENCYEWVKNDKAVLALISLDLYEDAKRLCLAHLREVFGEHLEFLEGSNVEFILTTMINTATLKY